MKLRVSLALLLFSVLSTACIIDQQQLLRLGSRIGIGGSSNLMLAQVVTPGLDGKLFDVRLPINCTSGSLTIEIQGVSAGEPNGSVVASVTYVWPTLPVASTDPLGFRSFAFASTPDIFEGSPFAVVMKSTGNCDIARGAINAELDPVEDTYPGGHAYYDEGSGWTCFCDTPGIAWDLPFQTNVLPVPDECVCAGSQTKPPLL